MSLQLYIITLNGLFRHSRETEIQNFIDFCRGTECCCLSIINAVYFFFPLPTEMWSSRSPSWPSCVIIGCKWWPRSFLYVSALIFCLSSRSDWLHSAAVDAVISFASSPQCWESMVGQALYRLVFFDFLFLMLGSFFGEFLRKWVFFCFVS